MWRHPPILRPNLGWAFLPLTTDTMGTRPTHPLHQVNYSFYFHMIIQSSGLEMWDIPYWWSLNEAMVWRNSIAEEPRTARHVKYTCISQIDFFSLDVFAVPEPVFSVVHPQAQACQTHLEQFVLFHWSLHFTGIAHHIWASVIRISTTQTSHYYKTETN